MKEKTFDELKKTMQWKEIRGCPGRFTLVTSDSHLSVSDLMGTEITADVHRVESVPALVVVVKLADGGLISYQREDGTCLHTLNTPDGFARKLAQLGIEVGHSPISTIHRTL